MTNRSISESASRPHSPTSHQSRATDHVLLTSIIPAHPGDSPVTPIIPALTQPPGGGGPKAAYSLLQPQVKLYDYLLK